MAKKALLPVSSEAPAGTMCADCESAPAARRRPCEDGEEYVCETCFKTAFERGLPRDSEPLDGDD